MDIVMSGLNYEVCLTYIDDVIVYSTSIDLQFTRLRLVLERLRRAGLKLKSSKCNLLCKSVKFLGHVLSAGKIAVDPEKVNQVLEWPIPINLKEVRGFVGLCSYYRRFIKDFARIAAPLNAMSEKNRNFEWNESCQQSMDTMKKLLTTAPLLVMPNSTDPFILDTDASQCTIGGVLSQIQDGGEHPVAYASKKLSKAEINYCVTRKELRAVVFFLKYYRHYLLGRKFTVRTDHAALQWLRRIPEPIGQQARWIGYMDEFDFELVHRSGQKHINADAMSRIPCRRKDCLCTARAAQNVDEMVKYVSDIRAVRQSTRQDVFIDCATTLNLSELFSQLDDTRDVQTNDEDSGAQNSSVTLLSGDGRPPPWPSWNNEEQERSQSTSRDSVKMVNEEIEMLKMAVIIFFCE
jgi:hypothetical protein